MSTKIIEILTNWVILSASFSSPRQQRRTELYAPSQNQSTPFSKLFLEIQPPPCFNRVFYLIKKLQQPSYTIHTYKKHKTKAVWIALSDGLLNLTLALIYIVGACFLVWCFLDSFISASSLLCLSIPVFPTLKCVISYCNMIGRFCFFAGDCSRNY